MDDRLRNRWLEASKAVYDHVDTEVGQYHESRFKAAARIAELVFEKAGGIDWPETHRQMRRRIQPSTMKNLTPSEDTGRVKSLRVGMAAATGDVDAIPPHEREFVDLALENVGWAGDFRSALRAPVAFDGPSVAPGETATVDAVFVWTEQTRRGMRSVRSKTAIALHGVAPSEAPVAFRLRKGDDGGWLDVRMIEGRLHRPILAPGSWREVGTQEIAASMGRGAPWADNPACAKPDRPWNGTYYSIEMATEDFAAHPSEATSGMLEDKRRAEEETQARCAGLVVVDGVVFRPTEVTLFPVKRRKEVEIAWRADQLVSLRRQRTMFGEPEYGCYDLGLGLGTCRSRIVYGVGEEKCLLEVARRMNEGSGAANVIGEGELPPCPPDAAKLLKFVAEIVHGEFGGDEAAAMRELAPMGWLHPHTTLSGTELEKAAAAMGRLAEEVSNWVSGKKRVHGDFGELYLWSLASTLADMLPNMLAQANAAADVEPEDAAILATRFGP